MLKIKEFEWYYCIQHTRKWATQARPMPDNLNWVPYYEKGKYDLAVLHIDQQCLLPNLGKSIVFREMLSQIDDIPIIVINHGTPVYPERFIEMAEKKGMRATEEAGQKWAVDEMKKILSKAKKVVVNSHEAKKMWQLGDKSIAIWHGMDADEWYDLKKEPRIITMMSPAGIGDKYYGRRFFAETRDVLRNKYGIKTQWIGENGNFAPTWDAYKNYIGKALIYFNPTLASPMPRSRTEAMISGACIVTTPYQDADMFIKDGVNGFLIQKNPETTAKLLSDLVFDYKRTAKIGQEGKKTALKIFSAERFRKEWVKLVNEVLEK